MSHDSCHEIIDSSGCLGIIECDQFKPGCVDFFDTIKKMHREIYQPGEKIVFLMTKDYYDDEPAGIMLQSIQRILNLVDISNFFVHLVTTNPMVESEYAWVLENVSTDKTPINLHVKQGDWQKNQNNDEKVFMGMDVPRHQADYQELPTKHRNLLENNKIFCLMPWVSMHIKPDSKVQPCCESTEIIGDCSQQSLKDIWNSPSIKKIRKDMLEGNVIESCQKCYFLENNLHKKNSTRQESLREFANHISRVDQTQNNGHYEDFKLVHLNLKYNNLCNLSCRMCGPTASTSWHAPGVFIGLIKPEEKVLKISGNNVTDILSQITQHLDHCQQILFEGGEPLIIPEFWSILEELHARKRYDIQLSYNTNLTQYKLHNKSIFDLWKKFTNVSVCASLDAEEDRGEYLRPGAKWQSVVDFRKKMMKEAPHVYIEIQPTVNIFNVLHLPDFHKSWVDKGFIEPQQWKINFLHSPRYMSVLTAPKPLRDEIKLKYLSHIEWLRNKDTFGRAISTFESVIASLDKSIPFNQDDFWHNTKQLDQYYKVDFLQVFPELKSFL
jgi:radical SAM protein with 4Fe4S-binding SPASM domain